MKREVRLWVYLIAAINTSLAISHPDTTLAPAIINKVLVYINYCLLLLSYILTDWKSLNKRNIQIVLVVVIWYAIKNLHVAPNATVQLQGGTFLLLLSFSLLSARDMADIMQKYRYFLIVSSALGLIAIFDYTVGLGIPHSIVPFYEDNVGVYIDYKFSYIHLESWLRLCGLFNEPGYFGTFLGFALVQEKFNMKKVGNIILLIAGIFTFSLAFYAIVIIGLMLTINNRKMFLKVSIFIATLVLIVPYIAQKYEHVEFILERLEFDSSSKRFVGDNRTTSDFDLIIDRFNNSDKVLFGYGSGYLSSFHLKNVSSYKTALVERGYLGFMLTYGLLLLCALGETRKQRDAIVFILCFAASIYQRPGIFTMDYFLLLFGGVHYIRFYNTNEDTIKKPKKMIPSFDKS